MRTKIEAAQLAQRSGSTMVIAHGRQPEVLLRILNGERIGTRFLPFPTTGSAEAGGEANRLESRKRWILSGSRALGKIYVDRGAAAAILTKGKSLLPVGVVRVEEHFERGETVHVYAQAKEIARGVVRYSADELSKIRGLHSDQIRECLGYDYGDEVIHRNDMVILRH